MGPEDVVMAAALQFMFLTYDSPEGFKKVCFSTNIRLMEVCNRFFVTTQFQPFGR